MSATTEAIEIIEELVEAKIPKSTAKKLIDYADKKRDDQVSKDAFNLLRLLMVSGFTLSFIIMGFLFNYMEKRFDKIEAEQKENRKLLLQILQKR